MQDNPKPLIPSVMVETGLIYSWHELLGCRLTPCTFSLLFASLRTPPSFSFLSFCQVVTLPCHRGCFVKDVVATLVSLKPKLYSKLQGHKFIFLQFYPYFLVKIINAPCKDKYQMTQKYLKRKKLTLSRWLTALGPYLSSFFSFCLL